MTMDFKQSTFGEIIESEREMILTGADQYGEFFVNAFEFNALLNDFVKSLDDIEKFTFVAFLSQVKKHHTLALFSAVRLHHIQTGMNLRQTLEAGAWAAYAMGNKEENKFYEKDKDGIFQVPERLGKAKNKWLDEKYKSGSDAIKRLKDLLNGSVAHSNIFYTVQNFQVKPAGSHGFDIPFFDYPDEFRVKTDLWFIGNIALGLLDLFYGVNKDFKVFQFIDDYLPRYKKLVVQNEALKAEMMKHERFKSVTQQK